MFDDLPVRPNRRQITKVMYDAKIDALANHTVRSRSDEMVSLAFPEGR